MKQSPAITGSGKLGDLMRGWNVQYPGTHLFGCRRVLDGKKVWYFEMFELGAGQSLIHRDSRGSGVTFYVDDVELKDLGWGEIEAFLWRLFDDMLREISKGGREKVQAHAC